MKHRVELAVLVGMLAICAALVVFVMRYRHMP